VVRAHGLIPLTLVAGLALTACGGGGSKESESPLNQDIQAVCNGSALAETPKLPPGFPQIEEDKLTYTKQFSVGTDAAGYSSGPTEVVAGYFHGDVKDAYEEFYKELNASGYGIVFYEREEHDAEIAWYFEGRTGRVAMREECGEADKTYVHITNRLSPRSG